MNLASLIDHLPAIPGVTYTPFHPAHLEMMDALEMATSSASQRQEWKDIIAAQSRIGPAITAHLNGRPVACFGYMLIWSGVAEMWLLIEERGRKYAKSLTRGAVVLRDCAVLSNNLHRIQITVRSSDIRAVRWASAIGFEKEATLHKYGPDQSDFFIFSRT